MVQVGHNFDPNPSHPLVKGHRLQVKLGAFAADGEC